MKAWFIKILRFFGIGQPDVVDINVIGDYYFGHTAHIRYPSQRYTLGIKRTSGVLLEELALHVLLDNGTPTGAHASHEVIHNIYDTCEITGGTFLDGIFYGGEFTGGTYTCGVIYGGKFNYITRYPGTTFYESEADK